MSDARAVSLALFGHAYRLDLLSALAFAGSKGIVISELAKQRSVSASVFYPPLHCLEELNLVIRQAPETGTRRVRYAATDTPTWNALRRLMECVQSNLAAEEKA